MAAPLSEISTSTPANVVVTQFLRDSPTQPLTCHDRCDCSALEGDSTGRGYVGSCSAQAQVRVTMRTGSQITFCGHHFAQHGTKITQVAVVYDERGQVRAHVFTNEDHAAGPAVLSELNP
jgi:hypothetical protein